MERKTDYSLVALDHGLYSVRSETHGETFHPQVGPEMEARSVYFKPMRIEQRLQSAKGPFVAWDVGLGGAGNVLNLVRDHGNVRAQMEIHSFDSTLEPLRFALAHSCSLDYLAGFECHVEKLIQDRKIKFKWGHLDIHWYLHLKDLRMGYPAKAQLGESPMVILYDPYSPAKNPELWSIIAFKMLMEELDGPCTMATYSRSTSVRVAMLCAGFFVGKGGEVGEKEETTIASNRAEYIDSPLDDAWLKKLRNSTNGEPIVNVPHQRTFITASTWSKIIQHPQFKKYSFASDLPMRH